MTKFTRNRKEILKYLNKQIKYYKRLRKEAKYIWWRDDCDRSIYELNEVKRFMTEKTDWI